MKRFLGAVVAAAGITALAGAALAQPHGGHRGSRGEATRHGMMGGPSAAAPATQITEDKAKELAQQYADKNLAGFTVERALPFTARHHTMYSVELKNSQGELRTLRVTPFGGVIPFGGPHSS